jgi:antitoxin component of MazEF toxin-antitoxin module
MDPVMLKTCILKVGSSAVVTLSAEMREALVVCEGSAVYVVGGDDGCWKIMPQNPELDVAFAAAYLVMDENYNMLQALA